MGTWIYMILCGSVIILLVWLSIITVMYRKYINLIAWNIIQLHDDMLAMKETTVSQKDDLSSLESLLQDIDARIVYLEEKGKETEELLT